MKYRLGSLTDIDKICELVASAIHLMNSQGIYQWDEIYPTKADFIDDIQKETLYVAILEEADTKQGALLSDTLAGLYVISTECDEAYRNGKWEQDEEKACILHRLCVSADVQHQGVGRRMLSHIENQLKDNGYESVRLDVFSENPFALTLYKKNGYQVRGYADWRKGRFFLMEKSLLPGQKGKTEENG